MPEQGDRCIVLLDPEGTLDGLRGSVAASDSHRLVVVDEAAAVDALLAGADLVMCPLDGSAPGAALAHVRRWRDADADLPVILIANPLSADAVIAAMRAGVHDVFPLPLPGVATMTASISRALALRRRLRELAADRERLASINRDLEHSLAVLREDEEAGRRVQQRILPEAKRDFGWCHVEHQVVPSLYLSGDFLDYFEIGEQQLAFYLADVSGHGASSAFVTMLLKTLGNRARRELRRDAGDAARPSLLLSIANRELLSLALGKHVAMFVGIINFRTRQLRYAVAGQYPQPIVFDGKCAEYVQGKGMPVGLFDDAVYEDRILALPEGFALVLLSDGVMELMGTDSLADKEQRLLDLVGSGALDVGALSRGLALDADQELPDDVAMLVIREAAARTGA